MTSNYETLLEKDILTVLMSCNYKDRDVEYNKILSSISGNLDRTTLFDLHYPNYWKVVNVLKRDSVLYSCFFLVIVNSIAFITSIFYCYIHFRSSFPSIIYFTLFIPVMLFSFYYSFVRALRGYMVQGPLGMRPSSLYVSLSMIMKYIKGEMFESSLLPPEPISSSEYPYFYYIFGYFYPVVGFGVFLGAFFSTLSVLGLDKCYDVFFYASGGFLALYGGIFTSSLASVYLLNTIYLCCWNIRRLIRSWVDRYSRLRRVTLKDLQRIIREHGHDLFATFPHLISFENPEKALAAMIRRDAYERYFLLQCLVSEIGVHMNLPLFVTITVAFVLFLANLVIIIQYQTTFIISEAAPWMIFSLVFFFFPVGCMSFANAMSNEVIDLFRYSAPNYRQTRYSPDRNKDVQWSSSSSFSFRSFPSTTFQDDMALESREDDFSVIGGRQEWMEFCSENPIQWSWLNMVITTRWLQTLALGAFTSIVGSVIPIILRAMSSSGV